MLLLLIGSALSTEGCHRKAAEPRSLYDHAWHQIELGNLVAALSEIDSASSICSDPRSEWYVRFRTLKAEILMRQGLYEDSLALLNFDLPPSLASSDIAVWQKLTQGADLAYSARFPDAQAALAKAQFLAEFNQPQLLGECMLRIGTLASLQLDLPKAQASYRVALDVARKQRNVFLEASALGSLGFLATRMERYDESVDWNRQALQAAQSLGALSLVAKIEGNIAWSYKKMGDLENSLTVNKDAEREALRAGLHQDRVLSLLNAGGVYFDMHDYAAAEIETQKALGLSKDLKDNGNAIYCLQDLALIALARGQLSQAQQYIGDALSLEAYAPDQSEKLYIRLVAAQITARTKDSSKAEEAYSRILNDPQSPTPVRWEAQAGLAKLHAEQGRVGVAEREFQESISTISNAWRELEHVEFRLSFLSSAIAFYDQYVNFLIGQNRPLDALKIADLSRAQTLEHGLSSTTDGKAPRAAAFRPQDTARRLNATLLFYWLGENRSYLWVVTPSKVSLFPLPASAEIDAAVKSYRQSFLDPRDPLEAGNADGKKLYATLVQPAEKLIPKNSRIIVLPDGNLNGLNFETLLVPTPRPHYWIEDVTVLNANSLSLLARAAPQSPPKSANLLYFGDALFASPDFPPLPEPGKETGILEKYFPEPRRSVLTKAQAIPSRFLSSKPEQFSFLHFATHGTASRTRPLESAIILSPEGDSYKLYARDIVQHPIHAYLVTISACNGAGTRAYAGEGLVGLSWAFLRAGAHNVIAGLWEVSNASTPQLMDELYKGLHAGQDPATALRNAKLTLVHSTGNYHRPFYWAPFQLYAGS